MPRKQANTSMASRVRQVLSERGPNISAKEVAEKLGTKPQYVHTIMYMDRKKSGATKRRPGRPRKFVSPVIEMPTPVVEETPWDIPIKTREQQLEDEVTSLKAIIRYLENKLYGSPI